NEKRIAWGERKRACYDKFIQYAGRPVERVELPYQGKSIAALLHLPPNRKSGERVPCVLYIPGMDGVKEDNPMHNDPLLERGIAVLAIDGPGQGETWGGASLFLLSTGQGRANPGSVVSNVPPPIAKTRESSPAIFWGSGRKSTPAASPSGAGGWVP